MVTVRGARDAVAIGRRVDAGCGAAARLCDRRSAGRGIAGCIVWDEGHLTIGIGGWQGMTKRPGDARSWRTTENRRFNNDARRTSTPGTPIVPSW